MGKWLVLIAGTQESLGAGLTLVRRRRVSALRTWVTSSSSSHSKVWPTGTIGVAKSSSTVRLSKRTKCAVITINIIPKSESAGGGGGGGDLEGVEAAVDAVPGHELIMAAHLGDL